MSTKHTKKVFEVTQHSIMKSALTEAAKALNKDEVPIGAVIINKDGNIIARAHNLTEHKHTQAAHAEVLAIEKAGKKIGDWRLEGCWLYVTLEPCAMCYNLAVLSRLDGIVYGAESPLFGFSKVAENDASPFLPHKALAQGGHSEKPLVYNSGHLPAIITGIEAEAAAMLLKTFFKRQRNKAE